jgi:hypothetical protein
MDPPRRPKTFISYTHDTDEHQRLVATLADRLSLDDVDVRIDRFVEETPRGGWPAWMEEELLGADYIVIVCTANYQERYRRAGDPSRGLGGRWESSLIRDLLYSSAPARLGRFVPVLTDEGIDDDIPFPLRFKVTHYRIRDYEGIYRHLTGTTPPPPLAVRPAGYSRRRDPAASWRFAPTIQEQFRQIDRRVEELTTEQYRVIQELHGRSKALISGTPGSGKTLVAAEKAIRLGHAGVKTLFLCHNPLLAAWVWQLTTHSQVDVLSLEDLLRSAGVHDLPTTGSSGEWTSYSGPTRTQLQYALETLRTKPPLYQAVIVDEGQDFADDWWEVVHACLPQTQDAILYVFFDERQSLLPYRMALPAAGWPLSLSRNCRNAGAVYEIMRCVAPGIPLPEAQLGDLGHAQFFRAARLRDAVSAALRWCNSLDVLERLVAILGGGTGYSGSVLARGPFAYGTDAHTWQDMVRREFRWLSASRTSYYGQQHSPLGIDLSCEPAPTESDIRAVQLAAESLAAGVPGTPPRKPKHVQWRSNHAALPGLADWRLRSTERMTAPAEVVGSLISGLWTDSLPLTEAVTFRPHWDAGGTGVPVYEIGDIKGLERDAGLLVMQGDAPQFMHHLFVGVSRPRGVVAVAVDDRAYSALPSRLRSRTTDVANPQ